MRYRAGTGLFGAGAAVALGGCVNAPAPAAPLEPVITLVEAATTAPVDVPIGAEEWTRGTEPAFNTFGGEIPRTVPVPSVEAGQLGEISRSEPGS